MAENFRCQKGQRLTRSGQISPDTTRGITEESLVCAFNGLCQAYVIENSNLRNPTKDVVVQHCELDQGGEEVTRIR